MMFGLKYAFHPDVIAVRQFGMAPREDVEVPAATGISQFECCVLVTPARSGFSQASDRACQGNALMIEARRLSNN